MRYLLVASDNSKKLPVDIPDEIIVVKKSVTKSTFDIANKSVRKRPVHKSQKVKAKSRKRKQGAKSLSK